MQIFNGNFTANKWLTSRATMSVGRGEDLHFFYSFNYNMCSAFKPRQEIFISAPLPAWNNQNSCSLSVVVTNLNMLHKPMGFELHLKRNPNPTSDLSPSVILFWSWEFVSGRFQIQMTFPWNSFPSPLNKNGPKIQIINRPAWLLHFWGLAIERNEKAKMRAELKVYYFPYIFFSKIFCFFFLKTSYISFLIQVECFILLP